MVGLKRRLCPQRQMRTFLNSAAAAVNSTVKDISTLINQSFDEATREPGDAEDVNLTTVDIVQCDNSFQIPPTSSQETCSSQAPLPNRATLLEGDPLFQTNLFNQALPYDEEPDRFSSASQSLPSVLPLSPPHHRDLDEEGIHTDTEMLPIKENSQEEAAAVNGIIHPSSESEASEVLRLCSIAESRGALQPAAIHDTTVDPQETQFTTTQETHEQSANTVAELMNGSYDLISGDACPVGNPLPVVTQGEIPQHEVQQSIILDELRTLNERLHDSLNQMSIENHSLAVELERSKREVEAAKYETAKLSERLNLVEERSRLLQLELKCAYEQLQTLEDKESEGEKNKVLEKELQLKVTEMQESQRLLERKTAENDEIKNELVELKRSLSAAETVDAKLLEFQKKREELAEMCKAYQQRSETAERQLQSVEAEKQSLLDSSRKEVFALTQELTSAKMQVSVAAKHWKTNYELENKLRDQEETIKKLKRTKTEEVTKVEDEQIRKMRDDELKQAVGASALLEKKVAELQAKLESTENKVTELTTWIAQSELAEQRLSEQLREARSRFSQFQTSNEVLTEELLNARQSKVTNSKPLLQCKTVLRISWPSAQGSQKGGNSSEGVEYERDGRGQISALHQRCPSFNSQSPATVRSLPSHSSVRRGPLPQQSGPSSLAQHQISLLRLDISGVEAQNQQLENECLRLTLELQQVKHQLELAGKTQTGERETKGE